MNKYNSHFHANFINMHLQLVFIMYYFDGKSLKPEENLVFATAVLSA